jgi:hypothetical protein
MTAWTLREAFDCWMIWDSDAFIGVTKSRERGQLMAAAPDLLNALTALRDAIKDNPTMQGREFVALGIQVNDALTKAGVSL